jgi:SAM-dependent methyltransferase
MPETWFLASMDLEDLPQGVRYPQLATPEAVVARYIEKYSRPGDVVLDPFAGYGSTLRVASRLGRQAYGIELDAERFAFASQRLPQGARLFQGDARELHRFELPRVDLCFTGPPFFASDRLLHLAGFPSLADDYDRYLEELAAVFATAARLMRPGAHAIALFANLPVPAGFRGEGSPAGILPLAWDCARVIDRVVPLVGEEIWCISQGSGRSPFAGGHAQILIFQRPCDPDDGSH